VRNDLFVSMSTYEATKGNERACRHLLTTQVQPMQSRMQQQCMTMHMMIHFLGCRASCVDQNSSGSISHSSNLKQALELSAGWMTNESVIVSACTHVQLIAID